MVPEAGIEPARPYDREILSLLVNLVFTPLIKYLLTYCHTIATIKYKSLSI